MIYILLENIRSSENVGSIFRTADAAGVSKIYLGGYTPAPVDRFGRPNKKVATRALGAEKSVEWESISSLAPLILKLKKEGFQVIAIEQDPSAIDYKKVILKEKVIFIIGNEVEGVSKELLQEADIIAEIPMQGEKESLNVSVAFGVALFRILNI